MNEYTDLIDKLYITELYQNIKCDTYFPEINDEYFKLTKISKFNEENNQYFRYLVYQNKKFIPEKEALVIENNSINKNILANSKPKNNYEINESHWVNKEELQTSYFTKKYFREWN